MTPRRISAASLGTLGPDRTNATRVADKHFDGRVSITVQHCNEIRQTSAVESPQ